MSVRNLGSVAWNDPLGWMETMKGPQWKQHVEMENTHFKEALDAAGGVPREIVESFTSAKNKHRQKDPFISNKIGIFTNGTTALEWFWLDSPSKKISAAAVCSRGSLAWSIQADSSGKEIYTLACYEKGKTEPIWKQNKHLAPYILEKDGVLYCLEETQELRYGRLVRLDAKSGAQRKVLYDEEDLAYNCSLVAGENEAIFLLSENSGKARLFYVGQTVQRLSPQYTSFFPVGCVNQDPCYFARVNGVWTPFGTALQAFVFPPRLFQGASIVFCSPKAQILILSSEGQIQIYEIRHSVRPKEIDRLAGNCVVDTWSHFSAASRLRFYVNVPGALPVSYVIDGYRQLARTPLEPYARYSAGKTRSEVPFIIVSAVKRPQKLLVIVYGGYGLATQLSTARWQPYLEAGWALVFALVRGGGDRDEEWAEAGRRFMKVNGVTDTEDVIRTAQKRLGISAKKTCLYGRSAGGYLVGSVVARYPRGGLIAAAYAEVPYVDILRTTTNKRLPLTVLEYDEFGNPARRIEDFETILRFSPVDALPAEGAPGVFVLARTSANDREVLTYESVKWITRLRGFPVVTELALDKLLAITMGAGHFIRGSTAEEHRAADFVLLERALGTLR